MKYFLRILLAAVLGMATNVASADDVLIDGIRYKFTSFNTVSLTSNDPRYSGNIVIPESIIYDGETYSVTEIGGAAFLGCTGLTSVTIPESVTSIGVYAFYKCRGLTSITIPNSVTSIGDGAFSECSFTSINIPNSVTSIGSVAFSSCRGLTSITIPNSVTSIEKWAFSGCTALASVTIPNSVTSIGYGAFKGCTGLTSVTIPEGVTAIGSEAFYDCTSLTSITIPERVTSIDDYAFEGCTGIKELSFTDSENNLSLGSGVFLDCPLETVYMGCNVDGTLLYSKTKTTLTTLTIGGKVSAISSKAFSGCTSLTSVTIPESVTSIGESAFSGCTGLKEVSLGSGLTTVGDQAFSGCTNIESLTLDCKDIKAWFADVKESVKEVTLGKHVESIAEDTFKDFSSLLRCSFGSVESLFGITFGNVQANPLSITQTLNIDKKVVTTIAIPKGITEIKDYVLYNCNSVNTVTGGPDVKRIGKYAFYYARKLNTLHIGDNVETIGEEAFWGCPLTSIHCYAEYPPTCDKFVFSIAKPNCKLYVRPGSVDMYSVHQDWYEFNILSLDDEALGIEDVNVNSNETDSETLRCEKGIYDLSGRKVNDDETLRYDNYPSKLKKGIYIVNGRKTVVR